MSTIAAALQIPTATPGVDTVAAAPKPNVATGAATALASEDFVLALTQALNAAAPPPVAAVVQAQAASVIVPGTPVAAAISAEITTEDEPSPADLAAAFAALLSFAVPVPTNTQPAAAPADSAAPLELLGTGTGAARPTNGPQQQLLEAVLSNTLAAGNAVTPTLQELQVAVPEQPAVPDQGNPNLLLAPTLDKARQTSNVAADAAAGRPLHSNVGTQAWTEELSTRVTMLAERGQQSASLRLSPEQLGPLEIRIAIRDDQASVWFGAAHADTRAAIEQALPRLREMFASQGLSLTDAGVSREPPREQPAPPRPGAFNEPASEAPVTITTLQRVGLLDAYA